MRYLFVLIVSFFFLSFSVSAQKSTDFLPEKPGKWSYSSNIKTPGAEVVAFNKNLAILAEWFHQNVPLLSNPKGFDLNAWAYGTWDDNYKLKKSSYALRAEIDFGFQLFYSKGGKWVIEPPHYSFDINDTETGHGTNLNYKQFSVSEYDAAGVNDFSPAQVKAINESVVKLNGIFAVFPFAKEMAPGVHVYRESVDGHFYHVIVFNPERPSYWLPVTLRELANLYLEYYTSIKDEFILPHLKKEIAEYTEEELNAPAYSGHDTHIVLRANGKGEGLQFKCFNTEYWDKTLPPSAIQFMTFGYLEMTDYYIEEFYKNNGHTNYPALLMNSLNLEELAGLITRKK